MMTAPQENPGYVDETYLRILAEKLQPAKQKSYELMQIKAGDKVLDVGCGPASDTLALGAIVGADGEVIGIDYDAEMIAIAQQRANDAGISDFVKHQQRDAAKLPFENQYFDACRSERLFQHVPDPEKILAEMVRVTKPGGWIVIVDSDHSSESVDTLETELAWKIRKFSLDRFVNGYAGRQLYRLLRQQNLSDLVVDIFPVYVTDYQLARLFMVADRTEKEALESGYATPEELQRLNDSLQQADDEGVFFGYGVMLTVAGANPSHKKRLDFRQNCSNQAKLAKLETK